MAGSIILSNCLVEVSYLKKAIKATHPKRCAVDARNGSNILGECHRRRFKAVGVRVKDDQSVVGAQPKMHRIDHEGTIHHTVATLNSRRNGRMVHGPVTIETVEATVGPHPNQSRCCPVPHNSPPMRPCLRANRWK
jgi:hypothetical protein